MSLPELLEETLAGEEIRTHVPLGGEDVLAVTSDRTLIYRGDGLLKDETVETYGHNAERVEVSVGRRKGKINLNYGLDGEETIALPAGQVDEALAPIMTGVLAANGVTDETESVRRVFRFNDLTLIVTESRLVKQIGSTVWDESAQTFEFEMVSDLSFEEGSVATSVVLTHGDGRERFKIPNDEARRVRESLAGAICSYHEVGSIEELRAVKAEADAKDGEAIEEGASGSLEFDEGLDPLGADEPEAGETSVAEEDFDSTFEPGVESESGTVSESIASGDADAGTADTGTADAGTDQQASAARSGGGTADQRLEDELLGDDTGAAGDRQPDREQADVFEDSPFESAGAVDESDVLERLDRLAEQVETQGERIERQTELIEQLISELRRGR